MKISEALVILNIKNYNIHNIHNISFNELKKYYHIQCLIYHPDKNIDNEETTLLFQNINHAYNVLKDLISSNCENENEISNSSNCENNNYNDLLVSFLNFIIKYYSHNIDLTNFKDDITNFKLNANIHIKALITSLFDNFSIVILEDLYHYLLKYIKLKNNEHNEHNEHNENNEHNEHNENNEHNIYNTIIEIIKTILEEKLSNHSIYILTPTILNLLNSDVYKLKINDITVYIPLWHNELNFENNIIKIDPLLDDHVTIDINNNIHYNYYNNFNTIIDLLNANSNIAIHLADQTFEININDLKFSKYQVHNVKNKGIPKINTHAILDNSNKGDIYFHIHLA